MSLRILAVYVSSTWLDLEPERKTVEQAVQRLRETKFVGMEYFGSRDETTRRASLDEVDRTAESHSAMLGAKVQIEAQFGPNSNEFASLGLKKKSDYKSPSRSRRSDTPAK
jgi:hypothetical protein